jgi:hypothetical protein
MRWPRSFRASAVARSTFASLAAAPFLPPTVGDLSDKRVGDSKEASTRFRFFGVLGPGPALGRVITIDRTIASSNLPC